MSFGVFEAAVGSEVEVGLAKQASIDNFAAAVYDVREKLGPILFASRDVEEFRHKVAMMKSDQSVYKIIEGHTFPLPKVIRRIVGKNSVLEQEFLRSITACYPGCHENEAHAAKFHAKDKQARRRQGGPIDDLGGGPMPGLPGGPTPDTPGSAPYVPPGIDNVGPTAQSLPSFPGDQETGSKTPITSTRRRADFESVLDTDETFEDHQGDVLKPKGDFKGYLKKVDQGAPSKVKRNFASRQRAAHYLRWCEDNNLSPIRLSVLDRYAAHLPTDEYFRLATTIQAWESEHHPKVPSTKLKSTDKVARQRQGSPGAFGHAPGGGDMQGGGATGLPAATPGLDSPSTGGAGAVKGLGGGNNVGVVPGTAPPPIPITGSGGLRRYIAWCDRHGLKRISARNINHYAQGNPQLAYALAMEAKRAIRVARRRYADPTTTPNTPGVVGDQNAPKGFLPGYSGQGEGPGIAKQGPLPGYTGARQRRTAAPDYLQKADDALTQLLNQKAEEFQQTIAPLQQALVTVQQAEQLQQQQNPLNVLPPPGTVNVMPGQADSTPGQLGMPDPNQPDISALVQALQPGGGAMGGVAPQGGGGEGGPGAPPPAAAGGGLPPDLDQSAQRAARRGKVRGAVRPRQAAGVGELWDRWKSRRADEGDALRGGDVDYDRFQSEHGVGERALQNLKQRNEKPDFAPINGQGRGRSPQGITVGRRHRGADNLTNGAGGGMFTPQIADDTAHADPGANQPGHLYDPNGFARGGRRRQAGPYDPDPEYDNVQYDTFNDPAPGSPQAEYQHPGQARGWKGQFAKEQLSPHDGEFYTKGRAEVRGGPGPETSKYWLTTPHGIHGPHFNVHDAFDAAEPFLAQDAEIGRGQGELFAPPRARGAARQRRPLARRKTGWTGWGPAVFPKTRKVAGWDWDNHLNGYLANKPQHFACECGDSFPTPSGFQRCACGRQYNSYVIGTGGSNREASAEKFIVREIPVRPDVIVANRKLALRKGAPFAGYEDFEDCESKNSDKGRPDAYCGEIKHRVEDEKKAYRRLVDPRTGTIHNLIDPGEIDEGEDPKHPTFRKQPKDWARRNGDGKWTPSAIG